MLHAIGLWLSCLAIWLLLSGYFTPLLLGFGVLSCMLVVFIALRMDLVDKEGFPIHLSGQGLLYWPWLLWEIVKSNIDVARRILDPALPISPTMLRVKTSQRTDLGRVIYANSITLTPGTVSTDVVGEEIEVHALTREAAEALVDGEMDRRVTRMEGQS